MYIGFLQNRTTSQEIPTAFGLGMTVVVVTRLPRLQPLDKRKLYSIFS